MIKGTFWLEEKSDGGVTIWIEDYEVEARNPIQKQSINTNKEKYK